LPFTCGLGVCMIASWLGNVAGSTYNPLGIEMEKLTLFISHSTNKPQSSSRTRDVRDELETLLAPHWRIFVDSLRINPGEAWRTSVLYHLATASAGIILFDKAALQSDWVPAEALILCFRRSMDPTFPLTPVLLEGLTLKDTIFDRYQPFQLNEVQALSDDRNESAYALAQRIAGGIGTHASPRAHHWVDATCGLMGAAKERPLKLAAEALKCQEDFSSLLLSKEDHLDALRRAIAQSMHWKPVMEAFDALCTLVTHRAVTLEQARGLKHCLMAKWVENEAIEVLACASRSPDKHGVLTLIAKRQEIVDHYFSRARFELRPDSVNTVSVSAAAAGDGEEAIIMKVKEAIEEQIVPGGYYDEVTGDPLPLERAVDEKLKKNSEVAFCALPEACVKGNVLTTLRKDFPQIVFIVRAEKRLLEHPLPGAEPLTPPVGGPTLNLLSDLSTKLNNLLKAFGT